MPPIPDLVRLSKLDTQFSSNPEYTLHTQHVSEVRQRRMVRREERWKKERELGRGSFGIVWLEQCIQGDSGAKARAVKRLQKLEGSNYYRELEAIALFSHQKYEHCFVKSFGWYDDKDSIYIAMEYLPNGDLQQYLGSPLPESECQVIVFQVLEGLHFMHQNEFTHRDLKPANILIMSKGPNWWVKIADFGITKLATEGLTALRTLTGTPAFAAPEVLGFTDSDSYTNTVDIWSLGVIAFLILTGETLFRDQRRLGHYVTGRFTFPSDVLVANKVSEEGSKFVESLMAPKSADRPGAEKSLQNSWLACLTEPAVSQIQRTRDASMAPNTQPFYSDAKASASWSTQEQPSVYLSNSSTVRLPKRQRREYSLSSSRLATAEPIPEVRAQAYIKVPATLEGHKGGVWAVAFSPDGKLIASASYDKTVRLWDSATGATRATLEGHKGGVLAVAFSPDGKLIASAANDKTVRLWDSATVNAV